MAAGDEPLLSHLEALLLLEKDRLEPLKLNVDFLMWRTEQDWCYLDGLIAW